MINGITAIIPTYNRAHLLPRAIDSVLRQTLPPRQVIVVDDGSTDNTDDVCRRYGHQIDYVRQHNSGASAARNLGVQLARCSWIAFLDSDDYWLATHLERIAATVRVTAGQAVLYFADMQVPDADGGGTLWEHAGFRPCTPFEVISDATPWVLMKRQPMMLQTSVIKRSALEAVGGLDIRFRLIHDTYLFCQLGIGGTACAVPGIGCVQTTDDQSELRLTTAIPLSSVAQSREACVMWELVSKKGVLPHSFRRLVRGYVAVSRWVLAKYDIRAGRFASGVTNVWRAVSVDPKFGWWLLAHGSARGYQESVWPDTQPQDG